MGGVVKNVLVIVCGIVDGCEFGENVWVLIIVWGYVELEWIVVVFGGYVLIVVGFCGLGDLILMCISY